MTGVQTCALPICAFSGIPAMILDESEVQNASYEELEEIAERYGIK